MKELETEVSLLLFFATYSSKVANATTRYTDSSLDLSLLVSHSPCFCFTILSYRKSHPQNQDSITKVMPLHVATPAGVSQGGVVAEYPRQGCSVVDSTANGSGFANDVQAAMLHAASGTPDTPAENVLCFELTDTELSEYVGTQLNDALLAERKRIADAVATQTTINLPTALAAAAAIHRRCAIVNPSTLYTAGDDTFVVLPKDAERPDHELDDFNAAWELTEEKVVLRATKRILDGEAVTVSYGPQTTGMCELKYNVTTSSWNKVDAIEIEVQVPEAILPAVAEYIDDAKVLAKRDNLPAPSLLLEGNSTKHFLTKGNPYPLTLRLCARAALGSQSTEEQVDQQLEHLLVKQKDRVFSNASRRGNRWRTLEMDLLIATLSRLSYSTRLRSGESCHKILREPPTMQGETLAGVPLAKSLCKTTAVVLKELATNDVHLQLDDKQIRTVQASVMKGSIAKFLPNIGANMPTLWDDASRAFLKGTDTADYVAAKRAEMDTNFAAVSKLITSPSVTEENWRWGETLLNKCTVGVVVPPEEVRIDVTKGEARPVTYEDADGDTINFKVNPDKKLVYSVNGEERAPIEKIVIENGITLTFPLIDKEVDLVDPASPGDAYKLVLSYIRALAESVKVQHDIPTHMAFTKQGKLVEAILPAACMLPHHPTCRERTYAEGTAFYQAAGETLHVNHLPETGNGLLLAMRGEVASSNPFSEKRIVATVPCRAMGSDETEDDKFHGLLLQSANMFAEGAEGGVTVDMPDLARLQSGEKGLVFTITFTVSLKDPLPRALWFHHALLAFDRKTLVGRREKFESIDALSKFLEAADHAKTLASLEAVLVEVEGRYGASLAEKTARLVEVTKDGKAAGIDTSVLTIESDGSVEQNEVLALKVAIEEMEILAKTREWAQKKYVTL